MLYIYICYTPGFPGGSVGKESACNAGDLGSILGLRRFPGEGHGNALQYSCLENPMDRGVGQVTVHRIAKSWTWLCDFHFFTRINANTGFCGSTNSTLFCLWVLNMVNKIQKYSKEQNISCTIGKAILKSTTGTAKWNMLLVLPTELSLLYCRRQTERTLQVRVLYVQGPFPTFTSFISQSFLGESQVMRWQEWAEVISMFLSRGI